MGSKIPAPLPAPSPTTKQLAAPGSPQKSGSLAWLWLLILAGVGYGGYRYYQSTHAATAAPAVAPGGGGGRNGPRTVSVVTTTAKTGSIPVYLRGLGSVSALNTVAVKSRVDGQLLSVHFTEGQLVKAGDLLAEIDPRPYQVQLQQAQGQLARDEAQLNDAKANLSRYEQLFNEKVLAKQQLDTQRASVGQFEGTLASDRAVIESAKLQLTYAKITAPITGRIGFRLVDVGNMVKASDPNGLVVITQMQPIAVLFTIPADNLPVVLKRLRGGVKLRVDAYDRDDKTKIASGTLLTVDNQIDQSTGTSRLKAVFDNKDGALFPNQFVNCRMLVETKQNTVIVPAAAIQRGPQGTYVYLAKPDRTATIRPITLGMTEGDDVGVDSGLQAGDTVIIEGQDKLQEGSKIETGGGRGGRGGTGGRGGRPGKGPGQAGKPATDGKQGGDAAGRSKPE